MSALAKNTTRKYPFRMCNAVHFICRSQMEGGQFRTFLMRFSRPSDPPLSNLTSFDHLASSTLLFNACPRHFWLTHLPLWGNRNTAKSVNDNYGPAKPSEKISWLLVSFLDLEMLNLSAVPRVSLLCIVTETYSQQKIRGMEVKT